MQTAHFWRRFLASPLLLLFLNALSPAWAWNAAGHRLTAQIAWSTLDSAQQHQIHTWLSAHPDADHWLRRARPQGSEALFIEAATWADEIRQDPRFHHDEEATINRDPRLSDWGKHKDWHYLDLDQAGNVVEGQLDHALLHLLQVLRSTQDPAQIAWALPWLIHLVADLHQPLHVGLHGDQGGNAFEIETPWIPNRPFTNLHRYWDELPGPPWLRGEKLRETAQRLMETYPAPQYSNFRRWQEESHALLSQVYPSETGSLLPQISEAFHVRAKTLAETRITAAGYRLGWLLQQVLNTHVSRETRP